MPVTIMNEPLLAYSAMPLILSVKYDLMSIRRLPKINGECSHSIEKRRPT
jgi:hypothetical protein